MNVLNSGVNPSGSAITKNGRILIVANNNNYGIAGEDSVSIFDLKNGRNSKLLKHSSFAEPYTVTIDEKRRLAYVTNSASPIKGQTNGIITLISLKSYEVVGTIMSDQLDGPSGMVIVDKYAFINNYGAAGGVGSGNGKSIVVYDLDLKKVVNAFEVPLAPAAMVMRNKHLVVACYTTGLPDEGMVAIYKTKGSDVNLISKIDGLFGPFAVAVSKDNQYIYATNFGSNNFAPFGRSLAMIDISGKVSTVDIGIQPSGLALTKDGKYIIVSCYNTLYTEPNYNGLTAGMGTLVYIRTSDHKVIKTIKTGRSPSNIILSPDDKYSYVSCYSDNIVDVIDNFGDQ